LRTKKTADKWAAGYSKKGLCWKRSVNQQNLGLLLAGNNPAYKSLIKGLCWKRSINQQNLGTLLAGNNPAYKSLIKGLCWKGQ
jgi:hypothetical protein